MEASAQPNGPTALSPGTETPVPTWYGTRGTREDVLHSVIQVSASCGNQTTIPVVQPITPANLPVPGFLRYEPTVNIFIVFIIYMYVIIVPTGILRLPWLRLFHAFSSVARKMPEYNSQRRGTVRTRPN
jgi:hypothetical protein